MLRIALMRERDLPAYKALRDAALADDPSAFTSDARSEALKPPEAYRVRLGLDDPRRANYTLVARLRDAMAGDRIVGAVSCESDSRIKVQHIGHLIGMMVRRDAQGRGIGRALLQACIEQARRADGLEMLTLTVTAENASAVRLYAGAGFERAGSLAHGIKVDGRYYTKDTMVMRL
jgi:ribosomal protein S18 acetylase RimI-like enzyme